VAEALCNNPEDRGSIPNGTINFCPLYLSLHLQYSPGVGPASNRQEYREFSQGINRCRRVRPTTWPPSVSRLSKNCGNFAVSQTYRSSRPYTRIDELKFHAYIPRVWCILHIYVHMYLLKKSRYCGYINDPMSVVGLYRVRCSNKYIESYCYILLMLYKILNYVFWRR
jgi:hypothetical protein